ncbi:Hypothetical predicted protein, partial [Pelobates cultripes]
LKNLSAKRKWRHNLGLLGSTVDGRVKKVEEGTQGLTTQSQKLEAQNAELQHTQSSLTNSLESMEDRHRSRNVKIRGIPETVIPEDLTQYARRLIATILTPQQEKQTMIDGVYRIPRATRAPADSPRDVILQFQTRSAQLTLMAA